LPQAAFAGSDVDPLAPPTSRSPVLGFLGNLMHGPESPTAMALTWIVMACVCTGMVLTIFFTIELVFRGSGVNGGGVNGRGDSQQMAEQKGEGGRGKAGPVSADPHPALTLSPFSLPPSPLPPSTASVARLIRIADCHWAIGSHSPHLGDDLEPGRKLVLLSGLAEFMFTSGVRVLLEGPATAEVTSRSSVMLRRGKLTARVEDPDARGFEVRTPGMKYTDLGTEFGVSVATDGVQELVVFRGAVRAEAEGGDGETRRHGESSVAASPRLLLPASAVILTANQAIRIAAPGKPMERIAADERRFYRAAERFALFSTGVGLDRGAADPHWQLTEVSTLPHFKAQPAVVAIPDGSYVPDNRAKAQWISNSKAKDAMPAGCRWTLRTHFDLTGFDPSSARIEGQVSVDNFLVEVRVNGMAVPIPTGNRDDFLLQKWLPLKIEEGFVSGENTLDIVIENGPTFAQGSGNLIEHDPGNVMGLCVDWTGTARPELNPKTED
jgi:hypothetical protein